MQVYSRNTFLYFAFAAVLSLTLFLGCSSSNYLAEKPMTEEEIVEANTEEILKEYENIGFIPRGASPESSAKSVAGHLMRVQKAPVTIVSSDPNPYVEWKSLTITVVDENENIYHLHIGPAGSLGVITDANGDELLELIK